MALVIRWMIVGVMALLPLTGHAMALGKLKVLSALNEPLNAEIEFTSVTEKELKGLSVSLASRADFDAAGVDRLPLLSQIKFIVSKKLDGRYFLELRTEQQLDEPFLHLLLQIEWTGGRLVREYTALIDPPYKIAGKAAPVEVPVITAPKPEAEAPAPPAPVAETAPVEAPKAEIPKEEVPPVTAKPEEPVTPEALKASETPPQADTTKETPPDQKPQEGKLGPPDVSQGTLPDEFAGPKVEPLEAAPREEVARVPTEETAAATEPMPAREPVPTAMSDYNVKRGDTLWAIAEKTRADNQDVTVEQVILAIYRTNKDAFFGDNVNNLKAGKILKIPEREEMGSVALPEARREFRAQYDAWQEYKLKLASASGAIRVTETPEAAPAPAMEKPVAPVAKREPAKPPASAADKGKQEDLLKIVRSTLQQEKSTPDKKVTEKESAKDAADREQSALAERAATLEESLESKRLENKDLSEKVGMVRAQLKKESRLIELENQSLAQQKPAPETKPVEPAPKPAEAVAKPAEPADKPVALKPEGPVKVEPLPPVKPAEAPPAAAKAKRIPPPPAPAAEKDFLSSILEAVQSDLLMPAVIGIVVLLSGGIALVYFRRRQKSIAEFEESILSADAISTDQTATTGDVTGQPPASAAASGGDTSFLSDFSQGGMGNIHTDEVDPVAESEVYLAYGRDETAEEILKEAMVKNPDRHEIKLKLLEIYHQRNDVGAFETLAEELYAALGGRGGKIWVKVEEMGRKLNPENPMFRGGAPAKTSASAPAAKPAAPAAAPAKTEPAGDFDFNLESTVVATAEEPAARGDFSVAMAGVSASKTEPVTGFESLDLGSTADDGLDFDIGAKDEPAAPSQHSPAAPASADNEINWEPEPMAAVKPVPETEASADKTQASGQWDETATKLDLAKAYIDMGDAEGARSILQEVMAEGNEAQKKQAQDLSAQIA